MSRNRAQLWTAASILIILGFIVGQVPAIMITAAVGACLVYDEIRTEKDDAELVNRA
jgi:hypothetical protein